MQTPVEIEFQGMEARSQIQAVLAKHVADLEQRFGRVTACRVVLKAPGGHHRIGGLHEVNIRLALPNGREVNVDRTAQADERHSNLNLRHRRCVQAGAPAFAQNIRELQGQVKHHDSAS